MFRITISVSLSAGVALDLVPQSQGWYLEITRLPCDCPVDYYRFDLPLITQKTFSTRWIRHRIVGWFDLTRQLETRDVGQFGIGKARLEGAFLVLANDIVECERYLLRQFSAIRFQIFVVAGIKYLEDV